MATRGAIQTGPVPKGFQIDSVDVIYLVSGAALTLAQIGITQTKFANNTAAVVSNILVKAANGLATAIQANPYVINVPVTSPTMLVTPDNAILIELDMTTQAAGALRVYGLNVKCHYNYN